ncbi:MAG: zinc dependent phospholipase C family protein [Tissierellia bacterium]|nr:zinc dependent phospholipase C family protein [Tissierellia bacterium]
MDSHKIVSSNIFDYVKDEYDLELNKKLLLWGSIAPDVLPKYRLKSHYPDQSVGFVGHELVKITLFLQTMQKSESFSRLLLNKLSRKIGTTSHFLADFFCYPHNANISCLTRSSTKKHMTYEADLNKYAKTHEFDLNLRQAWPDERFSGGILDLRSYFIENIENILALYREEPLSFAKDLDYAANINLYLLSLAFELAEEMSPQLQKEAAHMI